MSSELRRASELWSEGKTAAQIGAAIGRTAESVNSAIALNRELFPRRRRPEFTNDVKRTIIITREMDKALKEAAKKRGGSVIQTIRDAIIIAYHNGFKLPPEIAKYQKRQDELSKQRLRELNLESKRLAKYAGAETSE